MRRITAGNIKTALIIMVTLFFFCVSVPLSAQVDSGSKQNAEKFAKEYAKQVEIERQVNKIEVRRHIGTAEEYVSRGMFVEAKIEYEKVLEIDPDNKTAGSRILTLKKKIVKARAKELNAKVRGGINAYNEARYAASVEMFQDVLNEDPRNKKAMKYLAKAKAALFAEGSSVSVVKEVIVENGSLVLDNIGKAKQLYTEGVLYYKNGRYPEAVPFFKKALELNPDHAQARRYLERSLAGERENTDDVWDDTKDAYIEQVDKHWLTEKRKLIKEEPDKDVFESAPKKDSAAKLNIEKNLRQVIPSIKLKDANLKYVVKHLSGLSGINILLDPAAREIENQNITISLTDIPLLEAIKYIVRAKGLVYRIDDYAVVITTSERLFDEEMETRYYQLASGVTSGSVFSTSFAETAGETTTIGTAAAFESTTTIQDVLEESGVPFPEGSKIFLDKRTGILIVRNTPSNLSIIEEVLQKLDVVPYQIEIEARFVELTETTYKELGIEWMLTNQLSIGNDYALNPLPWIDSTGKAGDGQYGDTWGREGITHGVRFLEDTVGEPRGNIMRLSAVLGSLEFSAILHALAQKGDSNVLSAPKVTTVNNSQAQIKIVSELIYPTEFEITPPSTNEWGSIVTPAVVIPGTFETREVGILLSVVPTVGADKKTITLAIIPEVSSLTSWINYGTDRLPARQPQFETRNLSTSVVINDGDTVVMGGLIKETTTNTEDKIPILGDIPFIGRLFRNDSNESVKKNLVIFVTAKLVTPRGDLLKEFMAGGSGTGIESKSLISID